jgi:hypothetical protein
MSPPADDTPVIIFCPVCCATHDARAAQENFTCAVCGQAWSMVIDLVRLEEHAH